MSVFFPRFQELNPLFRLADELDRSMRPTHSSNLRSFAPRFDVKESKESYELHGELPGLEQSQINIEWSDENTLTISGQTETRNEYSNQGEAVEVTDDSEKDTYRRPSVEEEGDEAFKSTEVAPTNKETTVSKTDPNVSKYWITERSMGSFHRTFQFPAHVEHDGVKANLKNGILSILVPKAKPKEPRKIQIE